MRTYSSAASRSGMVLMVLEEHFPTRDREILKGKLRKHQSEQRNDSTTTAAFVHHGESSPFLSSLGKISLLERNPCFLVGQGQPARASRLFPFLHSLPIYLLTCFLPCWRCGDPGHFIDQCPVMEVGTLIQVQNAPQAAPNQDGMYQLPRDRNKEQLENVEKERWEEELMHAHLG
ncbi:hypothetical protein Q8A67_023077 [Cirrhinus molitorella]|uniref:CCHC-type domain-containing protein n=1 Tax=Cirrhinus molitorella TaxID=172907 RepID=A0AA88P6A0_9TELE|nr:hypothetical protein Q8A67_023077 [Cirrhinus molitorella]